MAADFERPALHNLVFGAVLLCGEEATLTVKEWRLPFLDAGFDWLAVEAVGGESLEEVVLGLEDVVFVVEDSLLAADVRDVVVVDELDGGDDSFVATVDRVAPADLNTGNRSIW